MVIERYDLKFSQLSLKKESLPCAMGYSKDNIPAILNEPVDEVFRSGEDLCRCQAGLIMIDKLTWNSGDFSLEAGDIRLNIDKTIFSRIKNSESIALFVCTAGSIISEKAKDLMEKGDMLSGYVYDTFGSLVVESAMDMVQQWLKNSVNEAGMKITNRYSPGYCGWDISEQKKLFGLMPENFCGVKLTEACLMVPAKSISGIIGIGKSVKFNRYTCSLCEMKDCLYRNLGN